MLSCRLAGPLYRAREELRSQLTQSVSVSYRTVEPRKAAEAHAHSSQPWLRGSYSNQKQLQTPALLSKQARTCQRFCFDSRFGFVPAHFYFSPGASSEMGLVFFPAAPRAGARTKTRDSIDREVSTARRCQIRYR